MKTRLRFVSKWLLWIVLILICAIGLYLVTALFLSFIKAPLEREPQCQEKTIVYLSNNGVHLSIVIPVEFLSDTIQHRLQTPAGTRFVSFGWGDRAFYLNTPEWSDLTLKTAFNALFLKSASAMHVTYYSVISSTWTWVGICPDQIERLITYIEHSFTESNVSNFIPIKCPGYTANDCFFEANGTFSCLKTCNVWVNQAFKAAGIRTSIWSPFVYGVEYYVKG